MRRAAREPAIRSLALAAVLAVACQRSVDPRHVVEVTRGELVIGVEVRGELAAVDSTPILPPGLPEVWNYKVAALADEGATIAAGELAVAFDASELERELETVRNELEAAAKNLEKRKADAALARRDEALRVAEAEAALRKAELKRAAPAGETAAIDLRTIELDRQLAEMAVARARNRAAQAAQVDAVELAQLGERRADTARRVSTFEHNLARMTVPAPRAGTVVYPSGRDEKRKVGDSVWRMEPTILIVSLDRMRGDGQIDEVDVARVAPGQVVSVRLDALPDVQLRAEVATVARGVHPRSDTDPSPVIDVELTVRDKGTHPLRPGMRFRGEIEIERAAGVVLVPVEAVFASPDGPVAYRARAGELERVRVTLGRRNARVVEVTAGLVAGDHVSRMPPEVAR